LDGIITSKDDIQNEILKLLKIKPHTPTELANHFHQTREQFSKSYIYPLRDSKKIEKVDGSNYYQLTRQKNTIATIQKQLRSESEIFKTELFKNWTRKNHAKFEYKNQTRFARIVLGFVTPKFKIHPDDITKENWKEIIPFDEWIKRIKKLSERFIIGDFGCGEALVGKSIGSRVINFDHVAIDSNVISCNMSNVSEHIKKGGLDVALFSLSLMGKNWEDYLKEASRCLNENGLLFISETTNSLSKRLENLRAEIKKLGFEIYKDEEIGLFTFIEARKLEISSE
jgi:hypothetical protein